MEKKTKFYNRKDLKLAMQQDAVILPHNIYRNAVLTINQHKLDTKLYKFYSSTIVATYKTMYLSTIGFLMRNAIDSGIFKNAQTTGGIGEVLDNFKYEYRALKILEVYDDNIGSGLAMLDDMNGHAGMRKYIEEGYEVISM